MNKLQRKRFKEAIKSDAPKQVKNLMKVTIEGLFICKRELKYSEKKWQSNLRKSFTGKHKHLVDIINYVYCGKPKLKFKKKK